jgi:hypothetical protein
VEDEELKDRAAVDQWVLRMPSKVGTVMLLDEVAAIHVARGVQRRATEESLQNRCVCGEDATGFITGREKGA